MSSKAEKVRWFLDRILDDAINDAAMNNANQAQAIREVRSYLKSEMTHRATSEYALMGLNDIMHWKKPKSSD